MIVIKNSLFPFGRYSTINLFGILFTKKKEIDERTYVHESIHTKQMIEMLFIFFYLWYGIEYLILRFFHKSQNCTYHDVSFEEEAYEHQYDKEYLTTRKHYAWVKYLKVRSNEPRNKCDHRICDDEV